MLTTHEIDQKLENTQPWANRWDHLFYSVLIIGFEKEGCPRRPDSLLALQLASLWADAQWSESWDLLVWVKILLIQTWWIFRKPPYCPLAHVRYQITWHFPKPKLPLLVLHPALCQAKMPMLKRTGSSYLFYWKHVCPSQLSQSCLCSLGSEQPDWGWTLRAESVDGARTTCLWRSGSLTLLLLGQLWLWLKRYAKLTSTQWHWSLKNVLPSQPLRHVFAYRLAAHSWVGMGSIWIARHWRHLLWMNILLICLSLLRKTSLFLNKRDVDIQSSNSWSPLFLKIRVLSEGHDLWWEYRVATVTGDKSLFSPLEYWEERDTKTF